MRADEHGWVKFDDPRFDLAFDYPAMTPAGQPVRVDQQERGDRRRVHVHTEDAREVYFELRQAAGATADEELAGIRKSVLSHTPDARFGAVEPARLAELLGVGMTFELGERVRTAVFAQHGATLYGVIYDPRSPSNERILTSLRPRGVIVR